MTKAAKSDHSEDYLDLLGTIGESTKDKSCVRLDEVIFGLGFSAERINGQLIKRVKNALRQLGWVETRLKGEGRVWQKVRDQAREVSSEIKHTRGPWKAEWTERHIIPGEGVEYKGWHVFSPAEIDYVGVIADCPDLHPDSKANAHLIAAAPELLEALKAARAVLWSIVPDAEESRIVGEQLRLIERAIAKAEAV